MILFVSNGLQAQIVNVESLRRVSDTSKWSGNASANFQLTQNNNQIIEFKTRIHIQYLYKKHLLLMVNDYDLKSSNNTRLIDKGIVHIRYNYRFHPRIAWEVFTQTQFNSISNIDYRFLLGTGPRFKLIKSKQYNLFAGTAVMYESEQLDELNGTEFNNSLRSSNYLSMALYPTDRISIVSTTYFQPRLDYFEDYRISNDTTVLLKIFKQLAFNTHFVIWYDAFPASDVLRTQYKWTNGLTYTF